MNFSKLKRLMPLLLPLSWVYGGAMLFRGFLYDFGILKSHKAQAPVVSVGNITAGGTGKTPVLIFLGQFYAERGKKVGILTRGYGRKSKGQILVTGEHASLAPEEIGDEPCLIHRELKKIPIAVDKIRWKGANALSQKMTVAAFLLDDGFQYRAIRKQVEIVVLDAAQPFGNLRLLPAGFLREPIRSVKRASLIWFTRVNETDNFTETARRFSRYSRAPMIESVHQPLEFRRVDESRVEPKEAFSGEPVVAFCAIGRPESFRRCLNQLKLNLRAFREYSDHHLFSEKDILDIKNLAKKKGVRFILCTEKDAVKLQKTAPDFWYLKIAVQITRGEEILLDLLPNLS